MRTMRVVSALILAALVHDARAQIAPPPANATVVNFDDMPGAPSVADVVGPLSTEYNDRGITFAGFGQNGGALTNFFGSNDNGAVSLPNVMYFISIGNMQNGGLMQSPEFLSFYPPIQSLQLDFTTLGFDCEGTMAVTVQGFAADSSPVGSGTVTVPVEGTQLTLSFSSPGASTAQLTTTHTCGTSLFQGVELLTVDNIAFIGVPSAASKCAQGEIDAAGKKAKAIASCYSKALQKGLEVDQNCIQKAVNAFDSGVAKSQDKGDCVVGGRHGDNQDVSQLEAAVDNLIASSVQMVTGGAPGPNICFGKKMAAVGKKASSMTKCFSNGAKNGTVAAPDCVTKAATSFTSSLKQCGTADQLAPLEALVDGFGSSLSRAVTVPTTTTTTTTSTTTTTTAPPPLGPHLSFTTTPGTADCSLSPTNDPPSPAPPLSGELDSDAAGTTKITDLGLGCLYIGGGAAAVAPSLIPENASTIFDSPDGTNLVASFGTGQRDCSRGPEPTQHCVNDTTVACSTDADCANAPGGCAFDANCFFGPPVPVNGFPQTCVVNTFAADGSGTLDLGTGSSSVSINLASRVYITTVASSACPQCLGGTCSFGKNAGGACTTDNTSMTTLDCPPSDGTFLATLPVDLTPLTTGHNIVSAADGVFCTSQKTPGAFRFPDAQAIQQTGSPSGDLNDHLPHPSVLVSSFCIPPTNNVALDNTADLPGPGSLSLPGNAQYSLGD